MNISGWSRPIAAEEGEKGAGAGVESLGLGVVMIFGVTVVLGLEVDGLAGGQRMGNGNAGRETLEPEGDWRSRASRIEERAGVLPVTDAFWFRREDVAGRGSMAAARELRSRSKSRFITTLSKPSSGKSYSSSRLPSPSIDVGRAVSSLIVPLRFADGTVDKDRAALSFRLSLAVNVEPTSFSELGTVALAFPFLLADTSRG
jgi:hypothetical protein